jgi:hypothetical protein
VKEAAPGRIVAAEDLGFKTGDQGQAGTPRPGGLLEHLVQDVEEFHQLFDLPICEVLVRVFGQVV